MHSMRHTKKQPAKKTDKPTILACEVGQQVNIRMDGFPLPPGGYDVIAGEVLIDVKEDGVVEIRIPRRPLTVVRVR